MKKIMLAILLLACVITAVTSETGESSYQRGTKDDSLEVRNPYGDLIRINGAAGPAYDALFGEQSISLVEPMPGILMTPGSRPEDVIESVQEEIGAGLYIDEHGDVRPLSGTDPSTFISRARSLVAPGPAQPLDEAVTIDRMTTEGSNSTYQSAGTIRLVGRADTYYLSDGSSWGSGAGTFRQSTATFDRVEVEGATIRYYLNPAADGRIFEQTDFDSGDHSARGVLVAAGPLVIEATMGSSTGVMTGLAEIFSNEITSYGEPRFNFYSSIVGSVVPFQTTYTLLQGRTWTPDLFDGSFGYTYGGWVDFASPVSVPQVIGLRIVGSKQVPDNSSIPFSAIATYENNVKATVSNRAVWSVEPADFATIEGGVLATGVLATDSQPLILRAVYTEGGVVLEAEKPILCIPAGSEDLPDVWEMYQGDTDHTGHIPIPVEPDVFGLRWQHDFGAGLALNPVTAADGKVFVSLRGLRLDTPSLFGLDARDGETLWSSNLGSVFSINPPSYAYGNVYIQTCNHGSDTYLWSFDSETGDLVFKSPHSAQWERYFAPTIFDGTVYLNGGTYGGMYAFDAFSGAQRWYHKLPQYDEWTPAVDSDFAYAYVGEYSPGLYVVDRHTGVLEFMIPDLNFDWNGWSMRVAPVLGTMDNAVAIHDGRIISFDTAARRIAWEVARSFSGQPALADGAIYAIDGSRVVVLDEQTGQEVWSWTPPAGKPQGTLVVTDSHLFVSTENDVYAVELLSGTDVWSFPQAGHLALSEEQLYIASASGMLTAITIPEHIPAALAGFEIAGPSTVEEFGTAQFRSIASYSDGRVRDRTLLTDWTLEPGGSAAIDGDGLMTTGEVFAPVQPVIVHAAYSERGVTMESDMEVDLIIGVTIREFIERNLLGAMEIKQQMLDDLEMALLREQAARSVLEVLAADPSSDDPPPPASLLALNHLALGMNRDLRTGQRLEYSLTDLELALDTLIRSRP